MSDFRTLLGYCLIVKSPSRAWIEKENRIYGLCATSTDSCKSNRGESDRGSGKFQHGPDVGLMRNTAEVTEVACRGDLNTYFFDQADQSRTRNRRRFRQTRERKVVFLKDCRNPLLG